MRAQRRRVARGAATSAAAPRRARRRGAVAVLVVGLGVGPLACGGGSTLDGAAVERAITAKLGEAHDGVDIGATRCPEEISADADTTFACVTAVGDAQVEVKVTTSDGEGNIRFTTGQAIVAMAAVQEDLEAKLHAAYDEPGDVLEVAVDCGEPPVRVLEAKSTFRCSATVSAQQMIQEVTVEDTTGNLTYRAVEG